MGKIHQGSRWLVSVGVIAAVSASLAIWWVSPSQRLKRQVDALIAAAISGDAKAVETALAGGVDVNCRDARGITVLMHAARGDRPKIADPTPTDHPEVVELLIKRGAEVNAKTNTGFVALFWAARYGNAVRDFYAAICSANSMRFRFSAAVIFRIFGSPSGFLSGLGGTYLARLLDFR